MKDILINFAVELVVTQQRGAPRVDKQTDDQMHV